MQLLEVTNVLIFCCSVIEGYFGCPYMVNLCEKDISFYIIYGMKGYHNSEKEKERGSEKNNAKNALLTSLQIIKEVKRVSGVKAVLIGISTGNLLNLKYRIFQFHILHYCVFNRYSILRSNRSCR